MSKFNFNAIGQYILRKVPSFEKVLESLSNEEKSSAKDVMKEFTDFTIDSYLEGKENIGKRQAFRQSVAVVQELLLADEPQAKSLVTDIFLDNLTNANEHYKEIILELSPELQKLIQERKEYQENDGKEVSES